MFTAHMYYRTRRTNPNIHTYISSASYGPGKEPFKRGILFTTVAGVLLLVGGILTWLGFNDMFGGRASMTGPLLIALAFLLLLVSMRQFLIARKRNVETQDGIQFQTVGHGTVTAMVIDRDDGIGAVTVIMDTVAVESPDTTWRAYTDEYMPPSYSEVTQGHSQASSNYRESSPRDEAEFEFPPPYEEAVRALTFRQDLHNNNLKVSTG